MAELGLGMQMGMEMVLKGKQNLFALAETRDAAQNERDDLNPGLGTDRRKGSPPWRVTFPSTTYVINYYGQNCSPFHTLFESDIDSWGYYYVFPVCTTYVIIIISAFNAYCHTCLSCQIYYVLLRVYLFSRLVSLKSKSRLS